VWTNTCSRSCSAARNELRCCMMMVFLRSSPTVCMSDTQPDDSDKRRTSAKCRGWQTCDGGHPPSRGRGHSRTISLEPPLFVGRCSSEELPQTTCKLCCVAETLTKMLPIKALSLLRQTVCRTRTVFRINALWFYSIHVVRPCCVAYPHSTEDIRIIRCRVLWVANGRSPSRCRIQRSWRCLSVLPSPRGLAECTPVRHRQDTHRS